MGATNSTLYTSPAGGDGTQVTTIILVNDTTTAVTATLYLVESGGTANATRLLLNAASIPTDGTPLVLEFSALYMNPSDTIQGLASVADQVSVHIAGVELD